MMFSWVFTLLFFSPILCVQKHKLKKEEVQLVELSDVNFFDNVYLEKQDYLILMVPDNCKECQGLMKEFEKSKDKIANEAPDLNIGYIHRPKSSNVLVRRALDANVQSSSLTVKVFVKNRLFNYEGRINMKRLEKWLREIKEKVDSEARLPPSGVIQMSSGMLHYARNEIDQPFNLLLAPAHSFIQNQKFANALEKVAKDVKSGICVGLVEEDMDLKELDEVSMESDNLIYVQKSSQGTLFIDVKEFKSEKIKEDEVISWIETITVPTISRIERKEDLANTLKAKDYVVIGYTVPRNSAGLNTMTKTIGNLATTIKSVLKSKSTAEFNLEELYLAKSGFFLSTNTLIAQKFGLENGVKDAVIFIFKYDDLGEKYFTVLHKGFETDKDPVKIDSIVQSLQKLMFPTESLEKDEL